MKLKIKKHLTRKHVPPLPPNDLTVALQKLDTLKISKLSKTTLAEILRAAANPHGEKIDVIIASLPKARRSNVEKSARQLTRRTADVMKRGSAALMEMDEAEFQRLLDEANNEQG